MYLELNSFVFKQNDSICYETNEKSKLNPFKYEIARKL